MTTESQELAPEDMEASWRSRLSGRPGPGTAALESGLPHLEMSLLLECFEHLCVSSHGWAQRWQWHRVNKGTCFFHHGASVPAREIDLG